MSSTLGVRQWFPTEAGDLARHAREFGISFVGDDDEDEVILKKECVSPTLPPIPPLIPLSSVRQVNSVSEDSEPGGYGGVFMVNSDTPEELQIFSEGEVGVTAPFSDVEDRLHGETDEGEVQVKVSTDACDEGVDCCADEAPMCTVVLDPLPTDLLRSLTEDGQISAEKAARSCCEWEQPQTLPLEQCSSNGRRSSSESAVRGLLRDLVSTVATRQEENGEGDDSLARSQNESLLHQPPVATHDNQAIDYVENNVEEDEESRDERRARHRKSETPRKAIRRRHERRSSSSGGKSKRRKRSTSCSTTSSTGSATSRHHHHHHKHRKHRRRRSKTSADELEPPPTPRVNPIFVWVKQDDTRIVEVLCEDYDKRNRIRITKTAQGWRAIPRTERLASAGSVTAIPTSTTDSHIEAPLCAVTSSLVSQDDTHPVISEEEDISACSITKDIQFEEADENEMEEEQEMEMYGENEQHLEDDTYDVANEIPEDIQEQLCTDSEMEPTDLSIPKSTCDEIEIIPIKGINPILPAAPTTQPKLSPLPSDSSTTKPPPVRPAHQPKPQHKSMFLESLLSSPRKCHQVTKLELTNDELQPLDLGVPLNRNSGSPTVSCSEERKPPPPPDPELKPKVKCLKVEDITLKNLLNKTVSLSKVTHRKTPTEVILDSTSQKSRLLELLTSEPAPASQVTLDQDLDPVIQLKKILSDPDLSVPDPLLVPRDRLHSLISCPGREIPHLLTMRPELRLPDALAYPALVRDPDLLVVSLAHLQRLLEKPEDVTGNYITLRDWQRYQTELLESQIKQNHQHQNRNGGDAGKGDLDAATAAALNQMLWLPYLTQLEAAAVACGNNQEFLTMLNAVFPSSNYPQVQGGATPFLPPFNVPPTDYKSHMELQQTLALWQEAMMQAAVTSSSVNNNNNTSSNNNLSGKNTSGTNSYNNKNHHSSNGRFPHIAKKFNSSSARTSPISPNFQHQQRNTNNNQEYLSTNGYNHHQYNQQRSHLQQTVRNNSGPQRQMKIEMQTPIDNEHSNNKITSKPKVTCKSLINLLSSSRKQEQPQESVTIKRCPSTPSPQIQKQHSHLLAALGNPPSNIPQLVPITQDASPAPTTNPIDLSGRTSKLKVKQHLIDPAIKPRLLKQDADKVTHPQLWHPLFGR